MKIPQTVSTDSQGIEETSKEKVHDQKPIELSRTRLKALSQQVKDLVKEGKFQTVNEALIETKYRDENNQEFKSYEQWKQEGFQVKKGEKAFPLWGRPKEHEHKNPDDPSPESQLDDDLPTFYPVAFVFSNAQVEPINRSKEAADLDELEAMREEEQEQPTIEM